MHNHQHELTRKELKKQIEELKAKLDRQDETYQSLIRSNEQLRDQIVEERKQRLSDVNYKIFLDRNGQCERYVLKIEFDSNAVRSSGIFDLARQIGSQVETDIVRKLVGDRTGQEYLTPGMPIDTKAWGF